MAKKRLLVELENEVIELDISVSKAPIWFGKVAGRVRLVPGGFSSRPSVWVGEFCFGHDAEVTMREPGLWRLYIDLETPS